MFFSSNDDYFVFAACIGTLVGSNVTEYVIVQIGCSGKTIVDFTTNTPVGMTKSAIQNPSTGLLIQYIFYCLTLLDIFVGVFQIVLSWIPTADQYGPQGFCAGAVDDTNIQSDQWCITFLVGFESPEIIKPNLVQGSASPLGTIFQNHTIFSIQSNYNSPNSSKNFL